MQHEQQVIETSDTPVRLLAWPEVRVRVSLSRSTVWRLVRQGRFPPPVRISPGRIAWVDQYVTG